MLSPQAFITPQGSAAHRALMQAGCEPPAHLRRSAASAEALGGELRRFRPRACGRRGQEQRRAKPMPNPCQIRATLHQRWSNTEPPAWVPRGQILPRSGATK